VYIAAQCILPACRKANESVAKTGHYLDSRLVSSIFHHDGTIRLRSKIQMTALRK